MDFNNISGLLERFKNLKPSDTYVKEAFIDVMKEVMNVEMHKEEIKVQGKNIYLSVHPALKTEIHLQKKSVLEALKNKLQKHEVENII